MRDLSASERSFLDQPAYLRLATIQLNGAPHLTVMWYRRDDDAILMVTPADALKVKNLRNDPRASAVVEDPESPQRYLELRGEITVIDDDQRARQELREVARRYIGDQADDFVDGLSDDPRTLLSLSIERVFNRNAVKDV